MIHGGQIFETARRLGISPEQLTDFSANINPQGMPMEIRQAVVTAMDQASHYPDISCGPLTAAIARAEGVAPSQVLCGNGAADLVFRLIYAVQPKKAMVFAPTFLEYERALMQTHCQVVQHYLNAKLELTEEVLDTLKPGLDMIFLCNPNNPTGLLTSRCLVRKLAERAGQIGCMLVLDECFMDFVNEQEQYSMVSRLSSLPHVLILKSFTKMYAMAGLRLGYCLCANEALLRRMDEAGQDWSVNTLAQAAGLAALSLPGFAEETRSTVSEERIWLMDALEGLGLKVFRGQANYLLFHAPGRTKLCEQLLPHRIMIRSCHNYPGLAADYYRIAVRGREDNKKLLVALRQVLTLEGEDEYEC